MKKKTMINKNVYTVCNKQSNNMAFIHRVQNMLFNPIIHLKWF